MNNEEEKRIQEIQNKYKNFDLENSEEKSSQNKNISYEEFKKGQKQEEIRNEYDRQEKAKFDIDPTVLIIIFLLFIVGISSAYYLGVFDNAPKQLIDKEKPEFNMKYINKSQEKNKKILKTEKPVNIKEKMIGDIANDHYIKNKDNAITENGVEYIFLKKGKNTIQFLRSIDVTNLDVCLKYDGQYIFLAKTYIDNVYKTYLCNRHAYMINVQSEDKKILAIISNNREVDYVDYVENDNYEYNKTASRSERLKKIEKLLLDYKNDYKVFNK